MTARVRPDHGCTVDGSTRHRGSAAQSPRDRSPTLARQRGNTRYAAIESSNDSGWLWYKGHEHAHRSRRAQPQRQRCHTRSHVEHGMRRGEHLHARGATWSMKCAVVSTCMQVEHGHAVHEGTPNANEPLQMVHVASDVMRPEADPKRALSTARGPDPKGRSARRSAHGLKPSKSGSAISCAISGARLLRF